MKCALITLHKVWNYGSVLQAYATQIVLEEMGHEVEIIDYISNQRTKKRLFFYSPYKNLFKKVLYVISRFPSNFLKYLSFESFINEKFNLTKASFINYESLLLYEWKYDAYIVGSDQVWNTKYNEGVDNSFLLNFIPNESRKYSIASSIGKNMLTESELKQMKHALVHFDMITVREKEAADILKKVNLESKVILDPTLLVSEKIWKEKFEIKERKENYILLFLLYNEDNGALQLARMLKEKYNLPIYHLCWKPKKRQGVDKLLLYKKPDGFLEYISNASFVVTNSFHGLAFSLNFGKEFFCVARSEFNGRMTNLLKSLDIENRFIDNVSDYTIPNDLLDQNAIKSKLKTKRDADLKYLKEGFDEKENFISR